MTVHVKFITSSDNRKIAYHKLEGAGPTVIFCGGYMSDMDGTKAVFLQEACAELGLSYIRFDYSGHGASSEEFTDGTIGKWCEDALAVVDQLSSGPLIIIGSSMGGWIGLLISLARRDRIKAFIGIAAAPDMTRELMWNGFSNEVQENLKKDGIYLQPSEYDDQPYKISYELIKDGENHILLGKPIPLDCKVRLFHGIEDNDVPPEFSTRIANRLTSKDVVISFNQYGDHRLSSDGDLFRLKQALIELK